MQILERYLGSNIASDIVKIYYGTEQVYPLGVNVIAGSGELTITAFIPSMGVEIPLNVNDLTFEGFAAVGEVSSFSALGDVTLQGFAAALGVNIDVTSGSVTINGIAPDSEILSTSGVGAITVTGFAATVDTGSTLLNGLVSSYNFNESSGNLIDQQGSNDGTVVGATQNGTEYSFDGVNDYVNIDDVVTDLANTTGGSWSVWVNVVDVSNAGTIISFSDTNENTRLEFTQRNLTGECVIVGQDAGALQFVIDSGGAQLFFNNTWAHFVLVQNGTTIKLYKDGLEVALTADTNVDQSFWFSDNLNIDNARIACRNFGGGGNSSFLEADIDNLRIYDRAISAAEVTEIYELEISDILTKELVSSYNFNESSGDLLDQTGSNDGTVVGATQTGTEYEFDGVNDYVDLGDLDISGDESISFWVRVDSLGTNPLLTKRSGSTNRPIYIFVSAADDNIIAFKDDAATRVDSNFGVSTGTWYHVVTIYDVSTTTFKMYVNGALTDTNTSVPDPSTNNASLQIGGDTFGGTYGDVAIDNLRIYNRAISAAEVTEIYNLGRS